MVTNSLTLAISSGAFAPKIFSSGLFLSYDIFFMKFWVEGAHWLLLLHLTRRGLYPCLMSDYAHRCRTSTLIMIPINFWRNSDHLKKKNIFLAQKLTVLLQNFFCKSLKFSIVNLSNMGQKCLKQSHFCPHISIFHIYELSITSL